MQSKTLSISLLAREINWLETVEGLTASYSLLKVSLLAREINWLETTNPINKGTWVCKYSLPTR